MKESRLFKIIYYLLENGHATASELAEKFEVSVRTIYRDVDAISSGGIPIYAATGRNGGIQILEDYVLDKSLFSEAEKRNILATLQSVSLMGGDCEKETLMKLSALFNVRSDNWFEVDFSRWGRKKRDNAMFEMLKNAVISRQAADIIYVSSYGEKNKRKIYPLKMMYKSKDWYVKAYCVDKSDFRTYKFNRILELELLSEEFPEMEYPELDYLKGEYPESKNSPEQSNSPIILCFPETMAYRVYDEFEMGEVTVKENGDLIVSAEMPFDSYLTGYLLSFGDQVEVIEPPYLREILSAEAKKIYEKNKA